MVFRSQRVQNQWMDNDCIKKRDNEPGTGRETAHCQLTWITPGEGEEGEDKEEVTAITEKKQKTLNKLTTFQTVVCPMFEF